LRPRSWAIALLAAGILALGILETRFDLLGTLTRQECQTTLCCEDCQSINVSRVIDGDTLDSPVGRVRLFGVDTPERGQPCYSQATERLRRLAGSSVRVDPGPRETDPNGRLLFYVYTRHGESIDEKLIREGLARAWTRDGQHRDLLVELERQARVAGSGCLW
jgi:endonuclease YncB( thermonuclease family)